MSETHAPYVTPDTVEAACDILATHGRDAKVVAGGQSLSLLLRQDLLDPAVIVDIGDLPELSGVSVTDGRVRIGATTTYSDLEASDAIQGIGSLQDAVDVIGDPQVRNLGTVGGALAHADPSLDILPPLLCLDATLDVVGPDGERSVPLAEFYDGYMKTDLNDGEIIAAVAFPTPATAGSAYEKRANVKGGWATVGIASAIDLADDGTIGTAHVALAAVDDTPVRAPAAEDDLEGAAPTADTIAAAAERIPGEINPLSDISGSVSYKKSLSVSLGRRSLRRASERAAGGDSR